MRSEGIRPPGAFTGRSGSVSKQGEPSPRTRGSSVSRILANTGRYRDMEARTTARGVQINAPPPPEDGGTASREPADVPAVRRHASLLSGGERFGGRGGGGDTPTRLGANTRPRTCGTCERKTSQSM